jgi:steroid 5-alpha reductase family enzyme
VGLVVGLHGGRMALGALVLFGSMTKYTYRFAADLPRYRFARVRWESGADAMPARTWWIKAQHDTLQQCLANSVLLALPVLLAASNPDPRLAPLEVLGWAIWAAAWALENVADAQKLAFARTQKRARRALGGAIVPSAAVAARSHSRVITLRRLRRPLLRKSAWPRHPRRSAATCAPSSSLRCRTTLARR